MNFGGITKIVPMAFDPIGSINVPGEIPTSTGDLVNTIKVIITAAYAIGTVACVVYLIYGGYKIIMSGGDPQKFKEGQDTLANALIGLVIIFASSLIFNFVASKLGIGNLVTAFPIPS